MTTFGPTALPQVTLPDQTKHVNYSLGMVLGVDDFTQEFTFLSGQDRRLVRDAIGYGVVSGLRVSVDVDAARGPRVQVAPGEALVPSGRAVCVCPAQCAYLNEWLAENRAAVEAIASPPASPPAAVELSVVACWAECATDDVPIPGEPCRSDDDLMAPSRLKESFELSLRLEPPAQLEEDAVRRFAAWARQIKVTDEPGPDVAVFSDQLRAAAGFDAAPASPPSPPQDPLDFLLIPPPATLAIPRARARVFMAALLRFWVEDVRPRAGTPEYAAECDCGGGPGPLDPDADCVLLASVTVPLALDPVTNALVVAPAPPVVVDETERPTLLHARMLQELLFGEQDVDPIVASGRVASNGAVSGATGSLSATVLNPTHFLLSYPGFDAARNPIVLGQPVSRHQDQPSTFEVIPSNDPQLVSTLGSPPAAGVVVRVRRANGSAVPNGFMVRIEQPGWSL